MKIQNKKKLATSLAAAAIAATILVGGGTFSYLESNNEDNPLRNTVSNNKVLLTVSETTGSEYEIIPGTSQDKDPVITLENTVRSALFFRIEDDSNGIVDYNLNLADGWTIVPGQTNTYYRLVPAGEYITDDQGEQVWVEKGTTTPLTNKYHIFADDKISYDKSITNADTTNADGSLKDDYTISFTAWAIQADTFILPNGSYAPFALYKDAETLSQLDTPRLIMDEDAMTVMVNTLLTFYEVNKTATGYSRSYLSYNAGKFGEDIPIENSDRTPYFQLVLNQDLDMNGYALIYKGDVPDDFDFGGFRVQNYNNKLADVTIHDGVIVPGNCGVYLKTYHLEDKVTLRNVDIFSTGPAVFIENGVGVIESGYFSSSENGGRYTLNLLDESGREGTAKFEVRGGTYVNFNPAESYSESSTTPVNFLADGYASYEMHGDASDTNVYYVVAPVGSNVSFSGYETVTVDGTDYTKAVFAVS